jgi:predicted ATPase
MITRIRIENFKSASDLDLHFGKFNCLIGMNGVGKSTILQAIDFIAQLMTGKVQSWLTSRNWSDSELNNKLHSKGTIKIQVSYRTQHGQELSWHASFNRSLLRCLHERIVLENEHNVLFKCFAGKYKVKKQEESPANRISFKYEGSILSQLNDSELTPDIIEFRDTLKNIRSLELLSPHLLRQRSRNEHTDIGVGGEKLAAYLSNLKEEARTHLLELLKQFYPNLTYIRVGSVQGGWKRLIVGEQFGEHSLETEATHLSDGLLRILAVLAQAESNHPLVLLDEIENGINPEIIEKLVDMLVNAKQQIIVTTHSPMILNYLEDKTARESVQFVYKKPQGDTKVRKFFEIPEVGQKLEFMGAGEAFVDTNLTELTKTCVALDEQEEAQKLAEKSAKGKA